MQITLLSLFFPSPDALELALNELPEETPDPLNVPDEEDETAGANLNATSVAKAGGFQSQSVKNEAVISYRNPLIRPIAEQGLKSAGFPAG